MPLPTLKTQEIPFDHPDSCCRFRPSPDKPFVATPAAREAYGEAVLVTCLRQLHVFADVRDGLDYLQVFTDPAKPEPLWFIEDGAAITALLPSDY